MFLFFLSKHCTLPEKAIDDKFCARGELSQETFAGIKGLPDLAVLTPMPLLNPLESYTGPPG